MKNMKINGCIEAWVFVRFECATRLEHLNLIAIIMSGGRRMSIPILLPHIYIDTLPLYQRFGKDP